jgi:T5SS/PEP-CTERM-associated repeat protein
VATRASSDWYQRDHLLLDAVRNSGWSVAREPGIRGYGNLREVRRGGQGIVYSATQLSTNRRVAIKVLLSGAWASRKHLHRFEREIDLIASLQHPHIVRLYDRGLTDQGHPYYVMEFIDGHGLDELIAPHPARIEMSVARHGRRLGTRVSLDRVSRPAALGPRQMLELFVGVCDAVAYAHQRGIVHRDIKPSNIRIDARGEPHVLDFGLAKSVSEARDTDASTQVSLTGEFMGSLPWTSPEHTDGVPDRIDARSDVYSLGVVLYQCLTGEFPYAVTLGFRDVLSNIQTAEPRCPSSVRSDLDKEIDTLVLKCLAKQPPRRYQDAAELREDVQRYLVGEPIQAKADSVVYRLRKRLQHHRTALALATTLVVVVAVGLLRGVVSTGGARAASDGPPDLLNVVDNVGETKWGTVFFANSLAGLGDRISIPGSLALGHGGRSGVHSVTAGQQLEAGNTVFVGFDGHATLDIAQGGLVRSRTVTLGQMSGASGRVTLTGTESRLIVPDVVYVGSFGHGELEIRDGAYVQDEGGRIGQNTGGSGVAVVDGPGTEWHHRLSLTVGARGPAELLIQDGATVSSVHGIVGEHDGAEGGVTITGAEATWRVLSSLCVAGWPGVAAGRGQVMIEPGGTLYVGHTLRLWPDGIVHLAGGTLCVDTVDLTTGGTLKLDDGNLYVNTFDGDLLNDGAWLAPAYSPGAVEVFGHYVQSGGALELRIHGTHPDEHDQLIVTGSAALGGSLQIVLAEGVVPQSDDELTVVMASAITGMLNDGRSRVDITGGGACEVVCSDHDVRITHFEGPFHSDSSFVDPYPVGPVPRPTLPVGPFPRRLARNDTPHHDLIFVGSPDDIYEGIAGQTVDFDFGDLRVVDGDGPDITIYEGATGSSEFQSIDVLVSEDGEYFASIRDSRRPAVRVTGDEAHSLGPYAASYDLAGTGLGSVRFVRVDGIGNEQIIFGNHGFDLDAIGAVHLAPAEDAPPE